MWYSVKMDSKKVPQETPEELAVVTRKSLNTIAERLKQGETYESLLNELDTAIGIALEPDVPALEDAEPSVKKLRRRRDAQF